MAVLAHPDDESLGFGGTLARYSAEEVETYLITATRGERGRFFSPDSKAEPAEVGRVREAELRAAAAVLGIREVSILGYPDGAVDQIDAATAIAAIVRRIRLVQPHVLPFWSFVYALVKHQDSQRHRLTSRSGFSPCAVTGV